MPVIRREFNKEELEHLTALNKAVLDRPDIMFKLMPLKSIKIWKEECAINGIDKTIIRMNSYFKDLKDEE